MEGKEAVSKDSEKSLSSGQLCEYTGLTEWRSLTSELSLTSGVKISFKLGILEKLVRKNFANLSAMICVFLNIFKRKFEGKYRRLSLHVN